MNKNARCLRCGAPPQSSIHQVKSRNVEIRMGSHVFVERDDTKYRDILTILKQELPYYERDDRDDFIYLARTADIERAADRLQAYFWTETQ